MRWLLFLSRLAFICGLFFLLSVSLQFRNWTHDEAISSTIIIIGYFLGLVIVPFVNLCYLTVFIVKRRPAVYVPLWLVISNVFFLLLLLFYIIYINGERYPAA
jgi:hypothetical protein